VRAHFRAFAQRHGMEFMATEEDDALFLEAWGAAALAAEYGLGRPTLDQLLEPPGPTQVEILPSLADALGRVRRIDACGVTALVSLYTSASEAGHQFTVANLSPHVAETLRLVGLKQILQSHIAVKKSQFGMHFQQAVARKYPSRLLIPA